MCKGSWILDFLFHIKKLYNWINLNSRKINRIKNQNLPIKIRRKMSRSNYNMRHFQQQQQKINYNVRPNKCVTIWELGVATLDFATFGPWNWRNYTLFTIILYLFIILLKKFHLFKIAELIISFCFKKISDSIILNI